MCKGPSRFYASSGYGNSCQGSRSSSSRPRSPSPPPPPPPPAISTLMIIPPLIDTSGPHTISPFEPRDHSLPDRDDEGKGKSPEPNPPSKSSPNGTNHPLIHGSTTTYPPGYNFILYLKILINWYNTYHPTGHLGTSGSTICYHIFHRTNLAPFHQTTLREHWATQPRVYTCPSCPLPYSSCPHRCLTPHAGKFFGLSDDPTILLDDLLTCFRPENHDLNDHNWGKIPRIEFQSLEQYERFLFGGLYTVDNNLKRNMETRLFQIHGFYVHFKKMVRELEGGVEGLLELYRGVVDLRNGEGEGRILGGVLEEIRRREKEEVMRKKRRWGDRGSMEEVMVGCDGVSTVSSGSSEGCVGSDKAADNDKRDGGFPSPTKKRKSVGTMDDEEDEDAPWGTDCSEYNARMTQELCRRLDEESNEETKRRHSLTEYEM